MIFKLGVVCEVCDVVRASTALEADKYFSDNFCHVYVATKIVKPHP